jgi:hypothetical protein
MKITILSILFLFVSCTNQKENPISKSKLEKTSNTYEVIKAKNAKSLLILFPGGGSISKDTKREFKIIKPAVKNEISLLLMNFNRHLWIENDDCINITNQIETAVKKYHLNIENVYIGGISIGGNVSLTLTEYLLETKNKIYPKGVFVVDSPIDLYALYESSQKDIKRKDFSEERLAEPIEIIHYFESKFGGKDSLLMNIQKVAPYTFKTKNSNNISLIKTINSRIYIEPDTLWYKEVRQTDFESTNAFALQRMHQNLIENNWNNMKLIVTKNKGYRLNGERNPHSWSIVDAEDLIKWINQ